MTSTAANEYLRENATYIDDVSAAVLEALTNDQLATIMAASDEFCGADDSQPGIDNDLVRAGDGNDLVTDIQGADTIDGGAGDDTIHAGQTVIDPITATDIGGFSDHVGDDPNLLTSVAFGL